MFPPQMGMICQSTLFSRSPAVGIVHGLDNITCSLTLKLFPSLIKWFNFSGTNYFYATTALALTLWGWVAIKETDGLSLAEVERIYDHRPRYQTCGEKQEGT